MKYLSKILLWQIPQIYFRAFCGVGGGLILLAALYLGFSGHGRSALMFLLLGVASLSGALRRKAP
jgi:predicted membrane protein